MSRCRPLMALVLAGTSLALLVPLPTRSAAADAFPPVLRPPTTAPVLDPFRLPDGPYGAGNRGIEYATVPGDPVHAAAGGLVAFAGPVAGSLFVTVDHGGGLRSTYGFVAHMLVSRGDRVAAGARLAVAGGPFHFGLRLDGAYVDPASWFAVARVRVHLVGPTSPPVVAPAVVASDDRLAALDWARVEQLRAAGARLAQALERLRRGGHRAPPRYTAPRPKRAPDGVRSAPTDALRLVPHPVASASGTSTQPGRGNPWPSSP